MVVMSNPDNVTAKLTELEIFEGQDFYECRVWIVPEETGGYSAHVVTLPGASSQGETEEEAIANLREAFRGTVEVYREDGQRIPWSNEIEENLPAGAKEKWILVNV